MKQLERKLKEIARLMPADSDTCYEGYQPTAEELEEDIRLGQLMAGASDEEKAKAIVMAELGKITRKIPVIVQKKHLRRIRRAYNRSGIEGVVHYVKPYMVDEHRADTIGKIRHFLK